MSQVPEKSQNSCRIKEKKLGVGWGWGGWGGSQIGSKLPPGPTSKVYQKFSHIYNGIIHLLSGCHVSSPGYLLFSTLRRRNDNVYFGSGPNWLILGGLGAITAVSNVRLSWHFDHRWSSWLYRCHLKDFRKLKFSHRVFTVPKVWVFGPTLTQIYPLKITKIKNSHQK